MQTQSRNQPVAGQLPVPRSTTPGGAHHTRPANIPANEWPDLAEERERSKNGLPSRVVPEVRFDANGAELPRYRALEATYREDLPGGFHNTGEPFYYGRYIQSEQEFYHVGPPAHYMEPVNQAAIDMTMQHPPGAYVDPVELLPL